MLPSWVSPEERPEISVLTVSEISVRMPFSSAGGVSFGRLFWTACGLTGSCTTFFVSSLPEEKPQYIAPPKINKRKRNFFMNGSL